MKWHRFFYQPMIQWIFSARSNPDRAIVVSNQSGKFQLHAHHFSSGFDRQVTKKRGGALFGSVSDDGKYLYYLNDSAGNERGHFVRSSFFGGKTEDITPKLPPYFSYSVQTDASSTVVCFTAAFEKENRVYIAPSKMIFKSEKFISEPVVSFDGKYTCVVESKDDYSELHLIENNSARKAASIKIKGSCVPLSFSKFDNNVVLIISNYSGCYRPVFCDFRQKQTSTIQHSQWHGDVFVLTWNEETGQLLVCETFRALQRLFIYNLKTKKNLRVGPRNGSFDLFFGSAVFQKDRSLLIKWQNFQTPPQLIQLYAPNYSYKIQTKSKYKIENIWFRSSDGERVQMWVVRKQKMKLNSPFIIDMHGGPQGIVVDEYMPEAQALLENGFGYCVVNYRGSIGFGKKFERKIYGNPGHWEVEDVVAARNWLVKKCYADPDRIILSGWSWGGYVTLLALGKYPNLWTAGIAGAAITDCVMQYEDEPAYFKATDRERFRGTPKTAQQSYIRSSPTTYMDRIKAPVLLLHGRNDARCPSRQIEVFYKKMKSIGKKVVIEWFSSGHTGGYSDLKLRISLFSKLLMFAKDVSKKSIKK